MEARRQWIKPLKFCGEIISSLDSQTQPNCYSRRAAWKHSRDCPHSLIIYPSSKAPIRGMPRGMPSVEAIHGIYHGDFIQVGREDTCQCDEGRERWQHVWGGESTWQERGRMGGVALSRRSGHARPWQEETETTRVCLGAEIIIRK